MIKTPELSERHRKLRNKIITLRGVYEGSVTDHTAFTIVNFENAKTPRTESMIICVKKQQQPSTPLTRSVKLARRATIFEENRYPSAAKWESHAGGPIQIIIIKKQQYSKPTALTANLHYFVTPPSFHIVNYGT